LPSIKDDKQVCRGADQTETQRQQKLAQKFIP
jgi:hypothetical protein